MCEWSHNYDESEWSLMTSLIRRLGFPKHHPLVVLLMLCVGRRYFAWTMRCYNQQNPGAATFRDGSFDRWELTKGCPRSGQCTMFVHFPRALRARWFDKSIDVGPIVRNGSRFPQRWRGGPVAKARYHRGQKIAKLRFFHFELIVAN